MKINELQPRSNFDEVKVRVLSKQGPREVSFRDGRTATVWDLEVIDDTGTARFTLWKDVEAEKCQVGEVISITNGWCKDEWNNQTQISLGKNGQLAPAADDPSIPTNPP